MTPAQPLPEPRKGHPLPGRTSSREGVGRNPRSNPLPESGKDPGRTRVPTPSPSLLPMGGKGVGDAPDRKAQSCIRAGEGRALMGRHEDGCDGPPCPGCLPCPEVHCQNCGRAHAETTCPSCLALARRNLSEAAELIGHLPDQAVNGRQAFHHHHGIPGGDAVVMLAPASVARPIGDTRPVYSEFGDPRPPLDVLSYWSNRWRGEAGLPTGLPPTVARVLDFLDAHLHQIADTGLFPALARDLARVVHSLENVLHAGHRPDVSRVPCLSCGSRLQKVWADREDRDHWRCPVCAELYDQGRYERAKHDQLASRGADRFVPVSDAIAVTGRPEQTVRTWMRLGHVAVQREATGRLLVWWPHVRDKHRETPARRRSK